MGAGAPAISGQISANTGLQGKSEFLKASGCLISWDFTNGAFPAPTGYTVGTPRGMQFAASNSNSIYGSSATITPSSLKTKWFIKY